MNDKYIDASPTVKFKVFTPQLFYVWLKQNRNIDYGLNPLDTYIKDITRANAVYEHGIDYFNNYIRFSNIERALYKGLKHWLVNYVTCPVSKKDLTINFLEVEWDEFIVTN